jgi:hypothetical protein
LQKQTNSKRYLFQADAIGVSGQIVHPFHDIIPVQAASALPDDGGFCSARVDGFRHKEIFSFSSAYTQVIGTETEAGVFETVSLSVVEKFNVLDVVTCDRIVARVTARHPGQYPEGSNLPVETSIVPIGSRFEGLRIGHTCFESLELAPNFFSAPEHASWTGLQRALENEQDRQQLAPLALPGPDGKPAPLPRGGQQAGLLGFCIALGDPTEDAVLGAPIRFAVPQFGTVHLGEFFCYPDSRSLTMLRVDLGCPVGGGVSAAAAQGGGRSFP